MEVLFSVKSFDVEFSNDLQSFRSPESKKVVLRNRSVRKYALVRGECFKLSISKANKGRNTKFYTQYHIMYKKMYK